MLILEVLGVEFKAGVESEISHLITELWLPPKANVSFYMPGLELSRSLSDAVRLSS